MSTEPYVIPPELTPLIDREVHRGGFTSHAELLRRALEYWAEHGDAIAALEEALDEMDAGLGRPWEEVDREFRQRNDLRANS